MSVLPHLAFCELWLSKGRYHYTSRFSNLADCITCVTNVLTAYARISRLASTVLDQSHSTLRPFWLSSFRSFLPLLFTWAEILQYLNHFSLFTLLLIWMAASGLIFKKGIPKDRLISYVGALWRRLWSSRWYLTKLIDCVVWTLQSSDGA